MSKGKQPACPIYVNDFLGDPRVRRMSGDAIAFYLRLILEMWSYDKTQCRIPDDPEMIATLLKIDTDRWLSIRGEIQKKK